MEYRQLNRLTQELVIKMRQHIKQPQRATVEVKNHG